MASTWKVTAQRPTTTLNAGGEFEPAMHVTYETGKGVRGHLTVPKSQYNADNVAKLIEADAAEIDKVHALSGEAPKSGEASHS